MRKNTKWADVSEEKESIYSQKPLTRAWLESQLRRTVREVFNGCPEYSDRDRMAPLFPSTSAHYGWTRENMGAVGAVLSNTALFKGLRTRDNPVRLRNVSEEFICANNELTYVVATDDLETRFSTMYERLLERAVLERPLAEPVGLSEALKVRTITKGPVYTYYVLKALQKYMWRVISKHPVFRLTGEPISPAVLAEQLGNQLETDKEFVSVDYEAATDNLHSWVSECIALEIADIAGLSIPEAALLVRSLTKHQFTVDGKIVDQQTGQLMGSVTSFPVLCLANAAVCRSAIEADVGHHVQLSEADLLINGDDAGMKLGTLGYRSWLNISEFAGLKASVGKVYRSKQTINLNSTFFRFTPVAQYSHSTVGQWEQVKYVNLGLLNGLGRSLGVSSIANPATGRTIGSRSRELWRSCPSYLREDVMKRFIKSNWDTLTKYNLPWGMPEWLGGLGIAACPVSEKDIAIARGMVADHVVLPPIRSAAEWQVRRYADKRLHGTRNLLSVADEQDRFDRLLGLYAVGLLFTREADTKEFEESIFQPIDAGKAMQHQLRPWERLWLGRIKAGRFAPVSLLTTLNSDDEIVRLNSVILYEEDDPEAGLPAVLKTSNSPNLQAGLGVQSFATMSELVPARLIRTSDYGGH